MAAIYAGVMEDGGGITLWHAARYYDSLSGGSRLGDSSKAPLTTAGADALFVGSICP